MNVVLFKRGLWGERGPGSSVGIATGYGLDGPRSNPGGGARFSAPVQTSPGAHPASCTIGTGSFPAVKSGRGVTLTPHPLPVPWSRKRRAIPLLPLWAVRSVQSLSACTRVHFTFYLLGETNSKTLFINTGRWATLHYLESMQPLIYKCEISHLSSWWFVLKTRLKSVNTNVVKIRPLATP